MITIFKYQLKIENEQEIETPGEPRYLCVQNQNEELVIYAEVDPDRPLEKHIIWIHGTGHEVTEPKSKRDQYGKQYLGTALMMGGALVWHVYVSFDFPF